MAKFFVYSTKEAAAALKEAHIPLLGTRRVLYIGEQ